MPSALVAWFDSFGEPAKLPMSDLSPRDSALIGADVISEGQREGEASEGEPMEGTGFVIGRPQILAHHLAHRRCSRMNK